MFRNVKGFFKTTFSPGNKSKQSVVLYKRSGSSLQHQASFSIYSKFSGEGQRQGEGGGGGGGGQVCALPTPLLTLLILHIWRVRLSDGGSMFHCACFSSWHKAVIRYCCRGAAVRSYNHTSGFGFFFFWRNALTSSS